MKTTIDKPILILINGISGAGKDTFVSMVPVKNLNLHRSDPYKDMLFSMGWDGERTETTRTILKDLVQLGETTGYNEKYLIQNLDKQFKENCDLFNPVKLIFYHVRDVHSINQLKHNKEIQDRTQKIVSMLIKRDTEPTEPNDWYNVGEFEECYDYLVYNGYSLEDLHAVAAEFTKEILGGKDEIQGE